MRKSKFTEEQIAYALRQVEAGTPPADVCRQLGVSEATFYIWKKKYAHLGVSELRRLRSLEDENGRLKRLVADLSLDIRRGGGAGRSGAMSSQNGSGNNTAAIHGGRNLAALNWSKMSPRRFCYALLEVDLQQEIANSATISANGASRSPPTVLG